MSLIDTREFNKVVSKLREFFQSKGFLEVHTQNRLSILAACEDPSTISTYSYAG
jgi:elongation factor P--beta-lysine ligase